MVEPRSAGDLLAEVGIKPGARRHELSTGLRVLERRRDERAIPLWTTGPCALCGEKFTSPSQYTHVLDPEQPGAYIVRHRNPCTLQPYRSPIGTDDTKRIMNRIHKDLKEAR